MFSRLFALVLGLLFVAPVQAHQLQVEPVAVTLRVQNDALTVEMQGNVQDITQSVSVTPQETIGNAFVAAVNQRVEAYLNERFVLTVDGVRRTGALQSLKHQGSLDPSRSKFQLFLRYPLEHAPKQLQLHNTMLDYLPNAALIVTAGGFSRKLMYGESTSIQLDALLKNLLQNVQAFTWLGVEHIFTGYDHMLFIVALLLLAPNLRSLIKTLTGFTIAHSITLILAALQIVTPPSKVIEFIIPLSILYVGLENLWFLRKTTTSQVERSRFWIASGFGLIHGFGFAGNLREIGLPSGSAQFWSLLAFNLGVEIAQVTLCAIAFPLLIAWRNNTEKRARFGGLRWETILKGSSIAVSVAGCYFLAQVLGIF